MEVNHSKSSFMEREEVKKICRKCPGSRLSSGRYRHRKYSVGARGEPRILNLQQTRKSACTRLFLYLGQRRRKGSGGRRWSPELIRPIPVPMISGERFAGLPGWMSLKCWESINT